MYLPTNALPPSLLASDHSRVSSILRSSTLTDAATPEARKHTNVVVSSVLIRQRRHQQLPQNEYTIRVSHTERRQCGVIRAKFVVKVPDFYNPKIALWMLTFCCDLHLLYIDMATVRFLRFPPPPNTVLLTSPPSDIGQGSSSRLHFVHHRATTG
ncbi:hypothetical protein TSMEX_008672 [Taenia solium]|eukprot:TsM_001207600 transcript=TsM_001207600 gene=TsM_001207600